MQFDDPLHNPPANELATLKQSSTAHCTSSLGGWLINSTLYSSHGCLNSRLSDYAEFNAHVSGVPQAPSSLNAQLG